MAAPVPSSPRSPASDVASDSFIVPSDSLPIAHDDQHAEPEPSTIFSSSESQSLLEALDQAHAALAQSRSENDDLKEQLDASKRQVQDQSDQIAMLRGKVEEARRGVMRLQTENRRQSQLQLASVQDNVALRSSKRASFILPPTPASPGGLSAGKHIHRRISSMSDPGLLHAAERPMVATSSPPSFLTAFPDNISGDRTTPPGPSPEEMAALKAELTAAQQALQEATDAREASETAVRALREFIAENAVGMAGSGTGASGSEGLQGLRLPPLPTDADVADEEASGPRKVEEPKRGWSGWLKRESSNSVPKAAPAPTPVVTSVAAAPAPSIKSINEDEDANAPPATTPLTNFVSSWTRSVSSTSSTGVAAPTEPSPISPAVPQQSGFRKFGFFSKSPAPSPAASLPPSQIHTQFEPEPEVEEPKHVPAPLQLQREGSVRDSVSSASVSDAIEPVSPPAEMVDVVLDRGRIGGGKEEYPGERTPTVGSVTGFAM
ncbi:hypothetical protein BDV93DRAFT_604913 [Ceratobasidium sp. AG-I]|nr:hypothetical protein BDV93DRAFT_604913 [Ceratobasidium sp. AG-I]